MTTMTDFGHIQLATPLFPLVNLKLMECCLSNTEIMQKEVWEIPMSIKGRETDLSSGLCQYSDLGNLSV